MSHTRLTAAALQAHLASPSETWALLDARDPQAYAAGHLEGALRLDRSNLDRLLLQTPKDRPVLIYCYHGNASQTYARMFSDFRFTQVYDLVGGWAAWEDHLRQRARHESPAGGRAASHQSNARLQQWLQSQGYPIDDLEFRPGNHLTPLMHAARLGDAQAVGDLIAAGAVVSARNSDGNHALWLACYSDSLLTIDALLAAGAEVNHQNDQGSTCLMYAASAGKTEVVRRLLRAGADIALRSLDDYTALDMASTMECLRLLREAERRALASRPMSL